MSIQGLRKAARLLRSAAPSIRRAVAPTLDEDPLTRSHLDAAIYTPLAEAVAEHKRRSNDQRLAAYVDANMVHGIPEPLRDGTCNLVLVRHVATPNYEVRHFISIVESLGPSFRPLILEFTSDDFSSQNDLKLGLGRLRLYNGQNRNGHHLYEHVTIIDVNASNAKPLDTLRTIWGEPLVAFHHRMLALHAPGWESRVCDISPWFRENGPRAKDYYKALLSLFLKDAILFENFLPKGKEGRFTREVVMPAFSAISEEAGCKPLIVALEPEYNEDDAYWLSYPGELRTFLREMGIRIQI